MVCDGGTYSYTGRAHPSMRNMRPMAPPKDRLMSATREGEGEAISVEYLLQLLSESVRVYPETLNNHILAAGPPATVAIM